MFGANYDELNLSRSHWTLVCGSYRLTGAPAPTSLLRWESEPHQLEADISDELLRARPGWTDEVQRLTAAGGGVPTRPLAKKLYSARLWLARSKDVTFEPLSRQGDSLSSRSPSRRAHAHAARRQAIISCRSGATGRS